MQIKTSQACNLNRYLYNNKICMRNQHTVEKKEVDKQEQQKISIANHFILPSRQLFKISEFQQFRYFQGNDEKIYFKCVQAPKLTSNNTNRSAKFTFEQLLQASQKSVNLSKRYKSKYILQYTNLVAEHPYICVLHTPIINNVRNFMKKQFGYAMKINVMLSIAKAIQEFHQQELCFRTLKLDTIVIVSHTKHLIEIAFSQIKDLTKLDSKKSITNLVSEINAYTAPELAEKKDHTLSCDIWSLGIIFYQILFNVSYSLTDWKQSKNYKNILKFPAHCPVWIMNFLSKMTSQSGKDRYKIKDVIHLLKKSQFCSESASKYYHFHTEQPQEHKAHRKYTI